MIDVSGSLFTLLFSAFMAVERISRVPAWHRRIASLSFLLGAALSLWIGVRVPVSKDLADVFSWLSLIVLLLVLTLLLPGFVRDVKAASRE
jgi:uncharacterized membrane protein YfcA